ncbi:GntR family transcriptional regulator [Escherichia coli]|uniref:GntR family transcriptional regulator n=1 Tax=Escherichia coli TaxID=562 RepID=UPI000B7EA74B|nr:GntR family transcriptional regulator [Escherichia coli]MBB7044280.1 GntR family transcriptional regulator [Escherichia coli]
MHLSTHPTSYPTRYQEIAAKLEQELRQHYRCGDYLPAEQQLAARFEVNRHTLRRAQAKECQRLEIPNMSPLLCVRTLNHRDGESSPAEYSVSLTRADMIEFTMEH